MAEVRHYDDEGTSRIRGSDADGTRLGRWSDDEGTTPKYLIFLR
jgi:hypothetical protein